MVGCQTAHTQAPASRPFPPVNHQQTMQDFCRTTPCGQAYTQGLTARRRGCAVTVPDGPTDFPTSYPGLRLGCLIDPVDNLYCATKMANPAEGDCLFYKSCEWIVLPYAAILLARFIDPVASFTPPRQGCYGELVSQAGGSGIDPAFLDTIDKICPGMSQRLGGFEFGLGHCDDPERAHANATRHTYIRETGSAKYRNKVCI